MRHLVDATRKAVEQNNWHAALGLALTLPDICGRINYPELRKASEARVVRWFDKYLADNYSVGPPFMPIKSMTGGDFYALRCAYLHQGEFDLLDHRARKVVERVILTLPEEGSHNNFSSESLPVNGVAVGKLQLRIDLFCEEICSAVDAWLTEVSSDERIQREIRALGKIVASWAEGF